MPNRFTVTEKWQDKWFHKLSPNGKLVFMFLCDNCDIAGFWEIDVTRLAFETGLSTKSADKVLKELNCDSVIRDEKYIWLTNFLSHQKNLPLNPKNAAHRGILRIFEKKMKFKDIVNETYKKKGLSSPYERFRRGYSSPIGKDKGKGKGKGKGKDKILNEYDQDDSEFVYKKLPEPYNDPCLSGDIDYAGAIMPMLRDEYPKDPDVALMCEAAKAYAYYKINFKDSNVNFQHSKKHLASIIKQGVTVERLQKHFETFKGRSKLPIWDVLKPIEKDIDEKLEKEQEKQRREKHNAERLKMLQENE